MSKMTDGDNALIVKIDGIDGCGKTTLIQALASIYRTQYRVLTTSEFGCDCDTLTNTIADGRLTVSQILKKLAKCSACELDDIERELLWAVASRRANRLAIPRQRAFFDLILVDRSNLGNLAYGLTMDPRLEQLFSFATTPLEIADIVLWIDTPVEICQTRLAGRQELDVIEARGVSFFRAVRENYKSLAANEGRIKRLDGEKDISALIADAMGIIGATGRLELGRSGAAPTTSSGQGA